MKTIVALAFAGGLLSGCATSQEVPVLAVSADGMFAVGAHDTFWWVGADGDEVSIYYPDVRDQKADEALGPSDFFTRRKVQKSVTPSATTWIGDGFNMTLVKEPCTTAWGVLDYRASILLDDKVLSGCGGNGGGDGVIKIGLISEDI